MSIEQFVLRLQGLGEFGVRMTMFQKLTKHLHPINIRKLRTYLVCLKLAFPDKRVSDFVDIELVNKVRTVISPYYRPNMDWKPGMNKWLIFTKLQEPPE